MRPATVIGAGRRGTAPRWRASIAAALLPACLATCQFLPETPSREHLPAGSPLLQLPSTSAGILVLPVANAPEAVAQPLAAAMADALCVIDLPADTDSSNRRSFRLQGTLSPADGKAAGAARQIRWEVVGADGKVVGAAIQIVRLLPQDWARPSKQVLAGLARSEAPAIASLVEDPAPKEVVDVIPAVLLYPVAGAPGDGQRSLTSALGSALSQAKIIVLDPKLVVATKGPGQGTPSNAGAPGQGTEAALAIAGSVNVGAAQARQQHVKITWSVLDQTGAQLGSIDQENDVPAGSLDRAWGPVAPLVALAAVDGIVPLLKHLAKGPR